jgi:hypothetical protein
MKIKVNVELIDDKHDLAWHERFGLTKDVLVRLTKEAWTPYLEATVDDELRYTLDVEVED